MKLWFTEIGEPLPIDPDVRLLRYGHLTRSLAQRGHKVTWWSSTFLHAQKKFIAAHDRDFDCDGVRLCLLHGPGYRRNVSLARIRHQRAFGAALLQRFATQPPPDIIIASVPTLEGAEAVTRYAKRTGCPVIVDIRDEWPDEFLLAMPASVRPIGRIVMEPWYRAMRAICKNASAIVAVSQHQLDYGLGFAKRAQTERDRVIAHGYAPNPVDPAALAEARAWWTGQGVTPGPLTACFFGTLGTVFNIDILIAAAHRLKDRIDLRLVICGDGPARPRFEKLAADLPNVIFPGWVNHARISALMEISDIGLAPYGPGGNARMSLPNKPFEYMAGGLPILSSSRGEIAALLTQYDCGLNYDPSSLDALCEAFLIFAREPERRRAMGGRARALLDSQFSHAHIVDSFETLMTELHSNPPGAPSR